jgi:hypothetical protein
MAVRVAGKAIEACRAGSSWTRRSRRPRRRCCARDPRPFAARLPRLDVLLDTSGEPDADLARDLARLGRGRLRRIDTYTDVAHALSAIFAP